MARKPTAEDRKKLEKTLWNLNHLDAEEDAADREMQRWQELADKDDLNVDDLTEEELKAFMNAVENNEIEVPFWQPWWEYVEVDDFPEPAHICCSSSTARPEITWSIAEIVFDYCSLMRRFDGDARALSKFEEHCPVWSLKHRPVDGDATVFCAHMSHTRGPLAQDLVLPALWDVAHIAQTQAFIMRVLIEVRKVVKDRWKKKVDFFLSFANFHVDALGHISAGIEQWVVQHARSQSEATEMHSLRKGPSKDGIKLPVIAE